MVWNRIGNFVALSLAFIFAACGDDSSTEPQAPVAIESANEINSSSIHWAGSYSGPEKIDNPDYLWVYYNTTDGCSYIYTHSGWTLFASGARNINDESNSKTVGARDGANGKDGSDGRDGNDGKDGKDGVDGKNGLDGRDGIDGKDGEDGFVFIRSTEEISDGVTYDVKSYAQLEAGNPYFYMYYKFFFVNNNLAKSYVCYHNAANMISKQVSYLDFTENDCGESSYIKTYSKTGYVTSTTQMMYSLNTEIKIIYVYYPSSSIVHYYAQYQGNKLLTATAYDKNGNALSTSSSVVLAAIENAQITDNYSSVKDSNETSLFDVKSITLDRYHVLGTSTNRNILATVLVNDISLIDTSEGVFIQVTNTNQDTVINFRAVAISQDTIRATISAPILASYSYNGKEYMVRLKIGEKVFKDLVTKFNVSDSYYNIAINTEASAVSVEGLGGV